MTTITHGPAKMTSKHKTLLLVGVVACLAVAIIWQLGDVAYRSALNRIEAISLERVRLYKNTLETALNQLAHLPLLIAQQQDVVDLLNGSGSLQDVRDYLSSSTTSSGAAVIYVLDVDGKTIVSSNWKAPDSFENRNYGFRPYFQDAVEGLEGRFFAVGVTTDRAGYFVSRPVFSKDQISRVLGVVVVKIELEELQEAWEEGGEVLLVTNTDNVVVSSSVQDWLFHTISPLSLSARQRIAHIHV